MAWTDTFAAELGYRAERRTTGMASWTAVEAVGPSPGTTASYLWRRVIDTEATYRVVAVGGAYDVPLQASGGGSELQVAPSPGYVLNVDQAEPLVSPVQVSVAGATSARSVSYSVDLQQIGSSTSGPSFLVPWDPQSLPAGEHALEALVDVGAGVRFRLSKPVQVSTSTTEIRVALFDYRRQFDPLLTIATDVDSPVGIRTVELLIEGVVVDVVTGPDDEGLWVHRYDTRSLLAGTHVVSIVATNNLHEKAVVTRTIVVDNRPAITLDQPIDGIIERDTLRISGAFSDDGAGTVVRGYFYGGQVFAESSGSPFVLTASLANVAPGTHTFYVQAADASGLLTTAWGTLVVPEPGFTFERVDLRPGTHTLLAMHDGALIYRAADGAAWLRDAAGAEVRLERSETVRLTDDIVNPKRERWAFDGDRIAVIGFPPGSPSQIYVYDLTGAVRVISEEVGFGGQVNRFPLLRGQWLAWTVGTGPLVDVAIYNLQTEELIYADIDGAISAHDSWGGYELVVTPGNEQLFYSCCGIYRGSPPTEIRSFRLLDGAVNPVASDAVLSDANPLSDGARLVWRRVALGEDPRFATVIETGSQLIDSAVGNPDGQGVLAQDVGPLFLDDGLLMWTESRSNASWLMAHRQGQPIEIAPSAPLEIVSVSSGAAVYKGGGGLHVWSEARGGRPMLGALPVQVVHDGATAFLSLTSEGDAVYRVSLL